ncbi:MAG TPA: hypothetical protein ENF67_01770 [Candidatus Pacearchaeota archaeon]|nr:hypothetical protein [Candidatus Pacearchaeota archaeon]
MSKKLKKLLVLLTLLLVSSSFQILSALPAKAKAEETKAVCAVYFTGIGCPHCAKTDPVILVDLLRRYKNFVVIEYEIYQSRENGPLLYSYNQNYGFGLGIPLIIFSKNNYIIGDLPILNNVEGKIIELKNKGNPCLLLEKAVSFENLNFSQLEGKPKIWKDNRVLIFQEKKPIDSSILRKLLTSDKISEALKGVNYSIVEAKPVPLSGRNVNFENAIKIGGWVLEWNGEKLNVTNIMNQSTNVTNVGNITGNAIQQTLTLSKIVALAAVDAINPCALAVLTLMLIAILTYNPRNKKNVLLAGLAFTCSVFVIYFIYGLIIIKFFQLIQVLTAIRLTLYKVLGALAIILGLLNIKDFFKYKPGGFAREMPLGWRPKVKKIISGITSPKGAFAVGAFVTIFLLPCTIGPYIIAGGILSFLKLIKTLPLLLLYNLIFVLPMLAITIAIYAGIAKVEDVSGWKERNIRKLHLVAGAIMFGLGLAMVSGLA